MYNSFKGFLNAIANTRVKVYQVEANEKPKEKRLSYERFLCDGINAAINKELASGRHENTYEAIIKAIEI